MHNDDPSWRYHATDDGGTLTFVVTRGDAPVDAGFRPRLFRDAGLPDAGASPRDAGPLLADAGADAEDAGRPTTLIRLTLERTPAGFIGRTSATLPHPLGRSCEVSFKTELLSCADGGLVLRTESATAVGDTCQSPAKAQPVPLAEHQLRRAPPP